MPPRGTRKPVAARQSRPGATSSPRPKAGTFTYNGKTYRLSTEMGIWPMLQFARASEAGWRTDDPRGLAALHAFLEDVIDPADWGQFQEDMIKSKMVDVFGLMTAAQEAVSLMMEAMAEDGKLNGQKEEAGGGETTDVNDPGPRPPRELKT